jgi:hypothetical protein
MSDMVDNWARAIAGRISRRQLLAGVGALTAGSAVGGLRREPAALPSPRGTAEARAPGISATLTASRTCPAEYVPCGSICCDPGGTCEMIADIAKCSNSCGGPIWPPVGNWSIAAWPNQMCEGTCVNLLNDPDNCGYCGNVCPPPPNPSSGTAVCSNGQCGVMCDPDFTTCLASDGRWECVTGECTPCETGTCTQTCCSGACVSLQTDPYNCGSCGHVCPAPANARGVCTSGACSWVCDPGYTDCGSYCADLSWDPDNCGACGTVCSTVCPPPSGWYSACANGVCERVDVTIVTC